MSSFVILKKLVQLVQLVHIPLVNPFGRHQAITYSKLHTKLLLVWVDAEGHLLDQDPSSPNILIPALLLLSHSAQGHPFPLH